MAITQTESFQRDDGKLILRISVVTQHGCKTVKNLALLHFDTLILRLSALEHRQHVSLPFSRIQLEETIKYSADMTVSRLKANEIVINGH